MKPDYKPVSYTHLYNSSRAERGRVGQAGWLLQNSSPPGTFSFACQKRTRKEDVYKRQAYGPLDDAGRAVVAGEAGDLGHHVHQHILTLTARTHRHIACLLYTSAPVNSFEFQPCGRTPQVDYLLC